MPDHEVLKASTTNGLPVAPSMGPSLEIAQTPSSATTINGRCLLICLLCMVIAAAAAVIAEVLMSLISLITNISFYGHFSQNAAASPAGNHLGLWVIIVPVIGGIIVGFMARYGSAGIRG